MRLELDQIRLQFPALRGSEIFLDNPAGTQVPNRVVERMSDYLFTSNANHGGAFKSSQNSDAKVEQARLAVAHFLNASSPNEIVFGPNMTSLTFQISRALAKIFKPGDSLLVTRLDHDANVSPWTLMAEDMGLNVEWVDFNLEDGRLDMLSLQKALDKKPKLVAVGYASNALGTINPVKKIIEMAKGHGAITFIDAVQYAPHAPIDVQDLDCDFLACSAYKFFGPHVGIMYGKYEMLEKLKAYKVRPAPNLPPEKWQTGTANFEGICGVHGALEYIAWLGSTFGEAFTPEYENSFSGFALQLRLGLAAMRAYEYELSREMLKMLGSIPGLTIYGLSDTRSIDERVPTFAVNLKNFHPRKFAELLNAEQIYVWDGNYYALNVTESLGLEESGGMVRIGPVHYNTFEELDRLGQAIEKIKHAQG